MEDQRKSSDDKVFRKWTYEMKIKASSVVSFSEQSKMYAAI